MAGAYVSHDGRRWRLVELPSPKPEHGEFPTAVVSGPAGFVIGAQIGQSEEAVVWHSADGYAWERMSLGNGGINAAASDRRIYVLAGDTSLGGRPAIWWSANGRDWQPAAIEGGDSPGEVGVVVAGGPGFVAAGWSPGIPGFNTPYPRWSGVPWTSEDGRTWTRLTRADPFEWAGVHWITRAGSVLYAFGWVWEPNREPVLMAWRSSDGLSWHRLSPVPNGGEVLASFAGLPDGRAVALLGRPAVTWISYNGSSWSKVDDAPIPVHEISSIAVHGSRLIAVGASVLDDGAGWQREGCANVPIWYRSIASLGAVPDTAATSAGAAPVIGAVLILCAGVLIALGVRCRSPA